MFDLTKLDTYKENNRIEAKAAAKGLPGSLWETYSSFANTLGGVILLGVTESDDKTLKASGVPDPEKLIKDFWNNVNNTKKVSANILVDRDVYAADFDGKQIVVINVPRAQRYDRPVYIGDNPLSGTYRRNGEGDYKCKKDEVQALMRDASFKTQDMLVLDEFSLSDLDSESIRSYRMRMKLSRPGHVWETLEDDEFLLKIGASGRGNDSRIHPTAAGLLMFGHEYDIVKEFPYYFLDYQENADADTRWTDRIISSSGDWSGNIYDFYFRVYNKIALDIKTPFKLEKGVRVDDTPVHKAIREALANSLIHADYYGRQGVVIRKNLHNIVISNPGGFRIDIAAAKSGGISDPRNATLIKMFNLIDIGERAGSGIPNIYKVWDENGGKAPIITEKFEPDRVEMTLDIDFIADKTEIGGKSAVNIGGNEKIGGKSAVKTDSNGKIGGKSERINQIIEFISAKGSTTPAEIADHVGLSASRIRDYLKELTDSGKITYDGTYRDRRYKVNVK